MNKKRYEYPEAKKNSRPVGAEVEQPPLRVKIGANMFDIGWKEGVKKTIKEEIKWLKSFQKSALKYYKFQNIEYNKKIEERLKELKQK